MDLTTTRQIQLVRRPAGAVTLEEFELVTAAVPSLSPGQLLVLNRWMSVDPAMRPRMDDRTSYVAPFVVGAPLEGGALGEVVESRDPRFAPGDLIRHQLGWREISVVPADVAFPLGRLLGPEEAYLGILGMPGLTAFAGLTRPGAIAPGDVVFVSAAAGAVGSAVGQMARLLGASRVIGSAGGPAKCRHLIEDLGFDAAIDHRSGSFVEQLRANASDGIDIYFDNVGGEQLEAAMDCLRLHARIVVCGMVAQYDSEQAPPGPRNLIQLIITRSSMHGLLVVDHADLRPAFLARTAEWLAQGALHYRQTVTEGLDSAPQAFLDLLGGRGIGKMLIRLGCDPES